MTERLEFSSTEKEQALMLYQHIREQIASTLLPDDESRMRKYLLSTIEQCQVSRNIFGLNPILLAFQTAQLIVDEIGLRRDGVLAVLLRCVGSIVTP